MYQTPHLSGWNIIRLVEVFHVKFYIYWPISIMSHIVILLVCIDTKTFINKNIFVTRGIKLSQDFSVNLNYSPCEVFSFKIGLIIWQSLSIFSKKKKKIIKFNVILRIPFIMQHNLLPNSST